jgi:hypothetical protein
LPLLSHPQSAQEYSLSRYIWLSSERDNLAAELASGLKGIVSRDWGGLLMVSVDR